MSGALVPAHFVGQPAWRVGSSELHPRGNTSSKRARPPTCRPEDLEAWADQQRSKLRSAAGPHGAAVVTLELSEEGSWALTSKPPSQEGVLEIQLAAVRKGRRVDWSLLEGWAG